MESKDNALKAFNRLPSNGNTQKPRKPPVKPWFIIQGNNLYWLCQACGWGGYFVLSLIIIHLSEKVDLNVGNASSMLITCITGLMLTHAFRLVLHRYNWFRLSLFELIVGVLAVNFIQAVIMLVISFGADFYIIKGQTADIKLNGFILFASVINSTIIFLVWSLIYFAIHFFKDFRKREIDHLVWERDIRDFELNKLKSQLNPHFVFNALNSIRALVDEDPIKAKVSITQLSNILRNSLLADRSKTISLQEEMKTVNDYLMLERLRYEDRLQVSLDIDEEALSAQVPPMMVQTIVENAVKHGISHQLTSGFIAIEGKVEHHLLEINIRNSGELKDDTSPTGFGLLNTRQRLKLLYGENQHFSIEQEAANTVNVKLSFPIK